MPSILLISGSPSASSRSAALLNQARARFAGAGLDTHLFTLRDFPAEDLILGRYDSPAFDSLKKHLEAASAVVVATPVYKAAYAGGLKALLDILPQTALRGKTILPLVTGGSPAHQLVIDYALKPVLAALGATDLHQGVYVVDKQVSVGPDGTPQFSDSELAFRVETAFSALAAAALSRQPAHA
ncbi:MAG: NADPH-dependent FMN reductase [Verrucomicrobia bacterium]|nr:NADPH-dependent FMN reductase [Verrucomicrobiota bacterium]